MSIYCFRVTTFAKLSSFTCSLQFFSDWFLTARSRNAKTYFSKGNKIARLYDNSDQRQIRTENQIRTKDEFGPNFEIRPKLFRYLT